MRRYIYIITLIIIIVTFFIYFTYQSHTNTELSKQWLQTPHPNGKMIPIGNGQSLYASVKGNGTPVVVIETGLGSISAEWWYIQHELSKYTTVVTYDRAGYGWSTAGDYPRTGKVISTELSRLLQQLQLSGPYILVGHDIGGLYVQQFTCIYPDKVKSIVFIDPVTSDFNLFKKELSRPIYKNLIDKTTNLTIAKLLAKAGILRKFQATPYLYTPKDIKKHVIEQYSLPKAYKTMLSEYQKGFKLTQQAIKKCSNAFSSIPFTLIHHSPQEFKNKYKSYKLSYDEIELIENIWMRMHANILRLSTKSQLIFAQKATQNIHLEEPEIVIETIKKVIINAQRGF